MNKVIIIAIIGIVGLLSQFKMFAQKPIGPVGDLTITDMGHFTGSVTSAGILAGGVLTEQPYKESVKKFQKQYSKRIPYFGGIAILAQINNLIDDTQTRIDDLTSNNDMLKRVLYYSKKKKNVELLSEATSRLEFLRQEVNNRQEEVTISGEKMNLHQNVRRTLSRIHRSLDVVDQNTQQSSLSEKIIKMIKN